MKKVKLPSRSKFCSHLSVFDLRTLLTNCMASEAKVMSCPICKAAVETEDLYVDQDLLSFVQLNPKHGGFIKTQASLVQILYTIHPSETKEDSPKANQTK
jgi:hypothetical protein